MLGQYKMYFSVHTAAEMEGPLLYEQQREDGKTFIIIIRYLQCIHLTLTALKSVCINYGDQRVFFNLKSSIMS